MSKVSSLMADIDVLKILDFYSIHYSPPKGSEVVISCIFHGDLTGKVDRNPSLSINIDKKVFNCLSCPAKGNMVHLVIQCEKIFNGNKIKYIQAIKLICEICKLEFDGLFKKSKDEIDNSDFVIEDINTNLGDVVYNPVIKESFFDRFYMRKNNYFVNKGYSESTLKYFEMGFGTKGNDKDRCVFPIRDENKNLIGWSGRSVLLKTRIKWLHQPSGFKKEVSLFNIDKALPHIIKHKKIRVVESIGNCMKWHEKGEPWTVAILGNQVSDWQMDKICEHADEVYLTLDPDDGGIIGTEIFINKIVDKGKTVYISDYNFGYNADGKALDVGDVSLDRLDEIVEVPMYKYIEKTYNDYYLIKKGMFDVDVITLNDGKQVACVEEYDDSLSMPQITTADYGILNKIEAELGIGTISILNY